MPHVVRCGSHHRVDGIPKGALEVVPHHPMVGFQVADNRLDSRTLAELLPSFLCQRLYWLIAGKTGYLLPVFAIAILFPNSYFLRSFPFEMHSTSGS